MTRDQLLAVAAGGGESAGVAMAVLGGDADAIGPLHDLIEEEGHMHELKVGEKYLIRTVTFYYTGRVKSVSFAAVVLADAAWIPDTGRFSDALTTGELREVEPYPGDVIVMMGSIVDATVWPFKLPREPK